MNENSEAIARLPMPAGKASPPKKRGSNAVSPSATTLSQGSGSPHESAGSRHAHTMCHVLSTKCWLYSAFVLNLSNSERATRGSRICVQETALCGARLRKSEGSGMRSLRKHQRCGYMVTKGEATLDSNARPAYC